MVALIVAIGGAIAVSAWFLLVLLVAAAAVGILVKALMPRN